MELIAGIGALLGFVAVFWWLLGQPDDPDVETAGFVAGNWPLIAGRFEGDER